MRHAEFRAKGESWRNNPWGLLVGREIAPAMTRTNQAEWDKPRAARAARVDAQTAPVGKNPGKDDGNRWLHELMASPDAETAVAAVGEGPSCPPQPRLSEGSCCASTTVAKTPYKYMPETAVAAVGEGPSCPPPPHLSEGSCCASTTVAKTPYKYMPETACWLLPKKTLPETAATSKWPRSEFYREWHNRTGGR